VAARVAAGERFSEPTAEEAAGARQSPEDLAGQLARASEAVASL